MSCNKKKEEELIKKINVEQEFADLKFKDMRSKRFGLTSCCPLDKLEKITSKKEICDWDDAKLPVYLSRDYKDKDDDSTYKWLFENATIPSWVLKACDTCPTFDDTPIATSSSYTFTMPAAEIDATSDYERNVTKFYILVNAATGYQYSNTFITIGYGVIPMSGDLVITMYGNTATSGSKNGALANEPVTVIADLNGDGNDLVKVDFTGAGGWDPQNYTGNITVKPGTRTVYCKFGISLDCTFCGEERKNDPDMYFFYDTTSLGVQEVINTYEIVELWLDGLRSIGAFNGNVYHTSVLGERWLDWAIMPYTGTFNNAGFCGGSYSPGIGTPGVIGPQNPNWANTNPTGGYVDAVTPPINNTTSKEWGVLDYMINTAQVEWFNAGDTTSTATYTGSDVTPSGQPVTSPGPPPQLGSKKLLVVVFADEATSPNYGSTQIPQPYHCNSSLTTPTFTTATGGSDGATAAPTPCWIADYDKFVLEHNIHHNKGSDYRGDYFIYPAYPASVVDSHRSFPLHVLAAITSGDNPIGSGILASAPPNGVANLSSITSGTNPYVAANKGKLDTYHWGYDIAQPSTGFTKEDFVSNLEAFWTPGDEECVGDVECLSIYVKDDQGNPIECYTIYVDNKEVGVTDENGFFSYSIPNASTDTKHTVDICHCITTTGGCSQQRVDITVTPEESKVVCTKPKVDCT